MVSPVGTIETGGDPAPVSRTSSPERLLQVAREYDRKGLLDETAAAYEAAIRAGEVAGDAAVMAEGLRRLSVVRHRSRQPDVARALCRQSEAIARGAALSGLVAEATNTFGGFELIEEDFDAAHDFFLQAEALASDPDLCGRVEQNLGTVASLRGDHAGALERYSRSLTSFLAAGNEHGCAVAYHNLSAISLDLRRFEDADGYLRCCLLALQKVDDIHLRGLTTLNRAEALLALGRTREARVAAETAANLFEETHAPRELADAYRVLGTVLRHEGQLRRAEGRLQLAIEVAAAEHCALTEVEASRELAVVLALLGRGDEARPIMATAARALDRLKPPGTSPDPILAGEYPAGVRARAELLGVLDPAALSHAERVAEGAAALARELGFDGDGRARARLGGYLHELPEEELADGIGWDVRPAVRCHRERRDGSGPGGLRGDAIPIDAEIVGIVDAHDRGEVEPTAAAAWWRPEILSAFRRARSA
ncbi:MAG: hypothetical protein ACREOQ_03500 [Gemmatimonadales bacterium]